MGDTRSSTTSASPGMALGLAGLFLGLVALAAPGLRAAAQDKPPSVSPATTPPSAQPKPVEAPKDQVADAPKKDASNFVPVPGVRVAVSLGKKSTVAVGQPLVLEITVSNPGSAAVKDIEIVAKLPATLEHASRAPGVKMKLAELAAGESRMLPLTVTPKQPVNVHVEVTANVPGGLADETIFPVNLAQPTAGAPVPPPAIPGVPAGAATPFVTVASGPMLAPPAVGQRFHFKIDPKTPVDELLPAAPSSVKRPGPIVGDDLAKVPEVAFQKKLDKNVPPQKARELIAHMAAKVNHVNKNKTDAFMEALLGKRADLAGLPMAMGDSCRMSGERSRHFNQALATIRRCLGQQAVATTMRQPPAPPPIPAPSGPAIFNGPAPPQAPPVAEFVQVTVASPAGPANGDQADRFWEQYRTACLQEDTAMAKNSVADQQHAILARIAALMQVLAPESSRMREGLARYLATISNPEATRALARLAIYSPEDQVRKPALEALKVRRERDYSEILVQGLRYPWSAVAKNAADAIVKLERKDLLPQLLALLEDADPRLPVPKTVGGKDVQVVRELVRINHHRNCLMCHSPGNARQKSADVVTAAMPVPGEPLPSLPQGYQGSDLDMLVRVDVTYLRQDFSMRQPVADAHPWPEMQRFDFLVRTRELSEDEAQEYRDRLTPTEPGVLSPYHRVALSALRELTGRDTGPTAEAWRRLLKMERE